MSDAEHATADADAPSDAPEAAPALPVDFSEVRASVEAAIAETDLDAAIDALEAAAEHPDSSRYLEDSLWLYRQWADLLRATDREDEAIDTYARAYALDPRDRAVLSPYAELLLGAERTEEAAEALRSLLLHHRTELPAERLAWIYRQLGQYHETQDDLEQARHAYEKALQKQPSDRQALTGLLRVVGTVGEPADVIAVRRKLIKSLDEPRARSMALVAMGNDWKDEFNDPWRALDTYEEALAEDAENTRALESIASVARELGDWRRLSRAYFTLSRLAETDADTAEWLIKSSHVARDELWEPEKALSGYRKALELDPSRLDAFKAVTSLLADSKDWEGLEAAYLQIISANQEAGGDEKLLAVLWQRLGDLYTSYLDRPDEAITAYHQASVLLPQNIGLHERVAELAEPVAERADIALEHLQALRAMQPERHELLERIGRVHLRQKAVDPAYCFFRAFDAVGGELAQKARGFVDKLSTPMLRVPKREFNPSLLKRYVFEEALDRDINRVFSLIQPALVSYYISVAKRDHGLGWRDDVNLDEPLAFNNIYKQIGGVFGHRDLPTVYRKPEQDGLINASLKDGGFIVGDDLMGSGREKYIAFIVAKQLFLFMPAFYTATVRPLSDLQVFFYLANVFVNDLDGDFDKAQQRILKGFSKELSDQDKANLSQALDTVVSRGGDIDLAGWVEALEATANRVGFIFSDDIGAVRDALQREEQPISQRPVDERIRELIDYSVSDRYLELRAELGMAVG